MNGRKAKNGRRAQAAADEAGAEHSRIIEEALAAALEHNLTRQELAKADCANVSEDFMVALGHLMEVVDRWGAPTAARAAALLHLIEILGIDRMGPVDAKIAVTLTTAITEVKRSIAGARAAALAGEQPPQDTRPQ